uniref:SH3 domain-containing protein n=1 Tax=Globodera pallida TaxID=36090 RepID=A0A183CKQ2_GLOPA
APSRERPVVSAQSYPAPSRERPVVSAQSFFVGTVKVDGQLGRQKLAQSDQTFLEMEMI